jgi:hypothetical protein
VTVTASYKSHESKFQVALLDSRLVLPSDFKSFPLSNFGPQIPMTNESSLPPPPSNGSRTGDDALHLGPRRKSRVANPLVSHGQHFGRAIHALCNVQTLITNGLLRMGEQADEPDESFTWECVLILLPLHNLTFVAFRQRREHRVFRALLRMVLGLEERFLEGSVDEAVIIAELVRPSLLYLLFHVDC